VIEMWMIFSIAVVFGLADAFMFPAMSAMPPRLLERDRLAAGNSLLQGSAQLTLVVGPLLAGAIIATSGSVEAAAGAFEDRNGLALVFAIDAITFVAPLWLLSIIRERFPTPDSSGTRLVDALKAGIAYVWNDRPLRTFMVLMGLLSLIFRGPFMIGVPAFANAWLPEGAAGFGTIISALGVGAIIGTIVAGTITLPSGRRIGVLLLIDFFVFGTILATMTFLRELWPIAALVLIGGVFDGFVIIVIVTWMQQRVDPAYLGRVMSVLMFVNQGFFPISSALAGAAASVDLAGMLLVSGVTMMVVAAAGVLSRTFRTLGHDS
jgi:Na+/melibiose symporter-like transporter